MNKEMQKHAYLIMAHNNFSQLSLLLRMLDNKRNDIFLHIDKKANNYSKQELKNMCRNSNLFFLKSRKVNWGGDSQIKVELELLKESTKTFHSYYHLLSGIDMPLKTQDEIHAFFDTNCGYDYVALNKRHIQNINQTFLDRIKYFYPLQNYVKRDGGVII